MMQMQGVAHIFKTCCRAVCLQTLLAARCRVQEAVTCCRGDESDAESSEDDDPKKPIPEWARGRALMQQLASQVQTDPDEVFQQHRKTCSLDEVFGHSGPQAHSHTNCCCLSVRTKCFQERTC